MVELRREQGKTILVVDDEPRIIEAVTMNLEVEGYQVSGASNGYEALDKVAKELPDLVILDVMMPEIDGFETLKRIREVSTVPVVMLTVKGEETDKVKGLDLGADDYVTKPFGPKELISRVKAALRRAETPTPAPKTEIRVDDNLSIDFNHRRIAVRGKEIHLRPTEYRLLYHLVSNAGRVLTHETLLRRVWGYEYRDEYQYLWLYITYLRQKLEEDPKRPKYILGERGIGYRFKELEKQQPRTPEPESRVNRVISQLANPGQCDQWWLINWSSNPINKCKGLIKEEGVVRRTNEHSKCKRICSRWSFLDVKDDNEEGDSYG